MLGVTAVRIEILFVFLKITQSMVIAKLRQAEFALASAIPIVKQVLRIVNRILNMGNSIYVCHPTSN